MAETWTSGAPADFARERYRFGAGRLNRVETLLAALEQNSNQIDRGVRIAHRRGDGLRVANIGLHRIDLADPAHRAEIAGELRAAYGNTDAVAAIRKRAHHMTAQKPRAAKHGDERFGLVFHGHRRRNTATPARCIEAKSVRLTRIKPLRTYPDNAQVAELVDALVSGTSG